MGAVLWNVVSNIIYDGMLKSDSKMEVVVNTIEVIIKHGNDTIIVSRHVYESAQNAKKNPAVQQGLTRTFRALETDEKITDFGIAKHIDDPGRSFVFREQNFH